MGQPEGTDLQLVKTAARRDLGGVPGVQGFGLGADCVRIYVRDAEAGVGLPTEYHGVRVEVVVVGDIVAR